MLGLCGSHRTGKTTLARIFAERTGVEFLETSTSGVFKRLGYDPKADYDFSTRLFLQEEILKSIEKTYQSAERVFIADRTPIDMAAYTLADIRRSNVSGAEIQRCVAYLRQCINVTNRHFSALVLLQPGIEIVEAEKSAPGNIAYMEHINALVMGLMAREDVLLTKRYISRSKTDLEDRVRALIGTYNVVLDQSKRLREGNALH